MDIWIPVIVAVISAIGSFLGVYYSNRKSAKESAALIDYRLEQVENKIENLGSVENRIYKLEEGQAVITEKIKVVNNRLSDLEKKG